MSLRTAQLFGLVDQLTTIHRQWVASEHEDPTPAYWDSVEVLVDTFSNGDIPAECRGVADAVERFTDEYDKYVDQLALGGKSYPHNSFFSARQQLEQARQAQVAEAKPPLESIEELIRQGVSNRQIAAMWEIQVHEVEAFRAGRWKPTEGYLPASERERLASISAAEMEAALRLQTKSDGARKNAGGGAGGDACPESVEELLRQGVSFKQVAVMKGLTEAAVLDVAKVLGISKGRTGEPVLPSHLESGAAPDSPDLLDTGDPGEVYGQDALDASTTPAESADASDATGQVDSTEAGILALAAEGYAAGDIAAATGVDKRKVNAVLRKSQLTAGAA